MKFDTARTLQRASLQNLRSFLLHGKECESISFASNQKRLDEPLRRILSLIEARYPNLNDSEPLNTKIWDVTAEYSEVYLELGFLAGIKAASELMRVND